MHPLLLVNGDIVFNTTGKSLVRMSVCDSKPVWVLDEPAHHSVEIDASCTLWVPSVSQKGLAGYPWLQKRIRDDSVARVSINGQLLENRSFISILRENDLLSLLFGTAGVRLNPDPIHMNQIQIVRQDSEHWREGDLLISARHLSTVFLYRSSTRKILWHQTGPWMNQHSIDFFNDHQISVFDNNSLAYAERETAFVGEGKTNRVLFYDFNSGTTSQPFAKPLNDAGPTALWGGRARVLPDGGLFVEETDAGRLLRFTNDRLLWSWVNDYDEALIGILMWSRYLTEEEARLPLQAIASQRCPSDIPNGR
jgi:hypothetical protein